MKQPPEEQKKGAPEWMATYGDLVTLLMCFFVLLFAFSSIDAQKFDAVMQSFQGSAGILTGGKSLSEAPFVFDAMPEHSKSVAQTIDEEGVSALESKSVEELASELWDIIHQNNMQFQIEVIQNGTHVTVRFRDNALFDPNRATLKDDAREILKSFSEIIKQDSIKYSEIVVEGHTDNLPTSGTSFPTNWELSAARSTNVVRFLIESLHLDPYKLSSAGYGEYRPITSNETAAGRALNRRVDIIIKTGGDNEE
ncbi:MAG: flagellar motor protein MotB [Bacillota bacterium]|nr:flagellar motor protein MotB [Bacillota bacterium]